MAETLNLGRLSGYDTGGTIHIIVNNQHFTAMSRDSYSTSYASGLARGFKDSDRPRECRRSRSVCRSRAARDRVPQHVPPRLLIDLIGYRRHGHNEGDEPAFTQPKMYRKIAAHPTVREIHAKTLVSRGVVTEAQAAEMSRAHTATLQAAYDGLKPEQDFVEPIPPVPPAGIAGRADRRLAADRPSELNRSLLQLPDGF